MFNTKMPYFLILVVIVVSMWSATTANATESGGWGVAGNTITKTEGALAAETEAELEFARLGGVVVLCRLILVGTVGPETQGEVKEVLNISKEVAALGGKNILCESASGFCEKTSDVEFWPDSLPWLTEAQGMESEPHILNAFVGGGGGVGLAWEAKCLVVGFAVEELCEGATSVKAGTTEENDVLEEFNLGSPVESQEVTCGAAEHVGAVSGSGLVLLVSGQSLDLLLCLPGTQYQTLLDCLTEKNAGTYTAGWNDYKLF